MNDEVALLIEEQANDERWGWRVHSLSADAFIGLVIPGDGVVGYLVNDPHRNPRYSVLAESRRVPIDPRTRDKHQYREPVDGFCMAFLNLGPDWSGSTRCSRRASVGQFCRSHAGRNGFLALDLPRGTTLCECGCGEPVNEIYDYAVARRNSGWTHQRIADAVRVERSYIGQLLRKPPRFIKGHSARVYWKARANAAS